MSKRKLRIPESTEPDADIPPASGMPQHAWMVTMHTKEGNQDIVYVPKVYKLKSHATKAACLLAMKEENSMCFFMLKMLKKSLSWLVVRQFLVFLHRTSLDRHHRTPYKRAKGRTNKSIKGYS